MNNNWSTGNCDIESFTCDVNTYYNRHRVAMDESRFVSYNKNGKKLSVFNRWTRQLEKVTKHFIYWHKRYLPLFLEKLNFVCLLIENSLWEHKLRKRFSNREGLVVC